MIFEYTRNYMEWYNMCLFFFLSCKPTSKYRWYFKWQLLQLLLENNIFKRSKHKCCVYVCCCCFGNIPLLSVFFSYFIFIKITTLLFSSDQRFVCQKFYVFFMTGLLQHLLEIRFYYFFCSKNKYLLVENVMGQLIRVFYVS